MLSISLRPVTGHILRNENITGATLLTLLLQLQLKCWHCCFGFSEVPTESIEPSHDIQVAGCIRRLTL